jgi:uncharacterized protein YbjT (DUF2867 family)
MSPSLHCLVTGASGYIGGRLVPELLSAGYTVRCMARDPAKLSDRPWSGDVEITVADATDHSAVRRALQGVDVAYYLIHSLGRDASFERRDRTAAQTFATTAEAAGVQRIVYLGGIISGQAGTLSPHLRSRAEVGEILLASGVPTAALQAAVISAADQRRSLELSAGQDLDGLTTYRQRAIFQPRGLAGHAYWRSISPFHGVVFGGMLRNITAAAERAELSSGSELRG